MANQFNCVLNATGILCIEGDLTQHSIIGRQQKYFNSIIDKKELKVDLSTINNIDTAGLAWLIALQECAIKKQSRLTYSQAPQKLVKLAKLSQVYDLLAWQ